VVGYAVSLLLGTGLVGGSTYLLFGFREDSRQLTAARAEMGREIAENGHALTTMQAWSKPEHRQAEHIVKLVTDLRAAKDRPQLDPAFQAQAERQAQAIVVALTMLKGDVQGAKFASPVLTRFQASLVGTLEPQIEMASVLRDLVKRWQSLSGQDRQRELDRVGQLVLVQLERQAHHGSVIRDSMAEHEQKSRDDALRFSAQWSQFFNICLKIALSYAGIAAGLLMLWWVLPIPGPAELLRIWKTKVAAKQIEPAPPTDLRIDPVADASNLPRRRASNVNAGPTTH
jgi:hypothetical protein